MTAVDKEIIEEMKEAKFTEEEKRRIIEKIKELLSAHS